MKVTEEHKADKSADTKNSRNSFYLKKADNEQKVALIKICNSWQGSHFCDAGGCYECDENRKLILRAIQEAEKKGFKRAQTEYFRSCIKYNEKRNRGD